ncbi:MAG TPA: DinB family protein [Fimbriimonadaceae bacterium]|nr:DinB family protein [Fimbriimonadaceae bacterium]
MTTLEFVQHQLKDGRFQIDKVFEGLTDEDFDHRIAPQAMSPREILEHLCECHQACLDALQGKSFNWGSYSLPDKSAPALFKTFNDLRAQAELAIAADPNETTFKKASEYLVAHDAYHVGQMALVRLGLDAAWDPYSIYNH